MHHSAVLSYSVMPDSLQPHVPTRSMQAHQAPLSMGILQARMLSQVAMPSFSGSSQPRDWTQVSCIASDSLLSEPPGKAKNTGVGSPSLLQGIFPI